MFVFVSEKRAVPVWMPKGQPLITTQEPTGPLPLPPCGAAGAGNFCT